MSPEPMVPLVFAWPYALIFWATFIWAFSPEFRIISKRPDASAVVQDAGSRRLIRILQPLAVFAAFAVAGRLRWAALPRPVWFFWAGIMAIVLGSLLRRHCFRMLGASFTGAVSVRPDQAVVERGAYRYVRHPSYTAGALMFLGIGLALGNLLGLVLLITLTSVSYGYRVVVEERALKTRIGVPYREYMRRTKRFIPFLF